MSFINDIAFVERVDELEVEGNLTVGGDILLQGEFPKIDQKIVTATNSLNSSISLKANQSDLDVVVVTLNMKADHEEVVASLSLKADQSELDSALSSVDSRIDGVDDLLGTKANQSALDTLETRASVLEDDLTSNASRVEVLETDLSSNASRIGVVETDLSSNASRVEVLETDLSSNASRVEVLETDLFSNASRIGVVETDLSSNAGRVSALETFADNNETRIEVLETDLTERTLRIEDLEDNMTSNASRLTTVEDSYATTSYVDSAVVTSSAIGVLIDTALTGFATTSELSATTQNLTDLSDDIVATYVPYPLDWVLYTPLGNSLSFYVDGKIGDYSDIVRKPSDWLSYRPTPGSDTTLKSYTEKKILEDINKLLDGGYVRPFTAKKRRY